MSKFPDIPIGGFYRKNYPDWLYLYCRVSNNKYQLVARRAHRNHLVRPAYDREPIVWLNDNYDLMIVVDPFIVPY